MNKTTKIIVIVVILILLGGGGFYLFHKSQKAAMQSGQTAMMQPQSGQMTTQKKSLADFFSMTGSQKCTFTDKATGSSGNVYVSSGKMRGDFQSTNNGKTTASHMINDGKYVYYLSDGEKSGYKMSLDYVKQQAAQISVAPKDNTTSDDQTPSQAVDMKQQSDYSCSAWSEDGSMFTVPTDITFTDYSTMMQGAMHGGVTPPAGGGMTSQQKSSECAQCDQVPAGAMRNQCKAALKC